MNKQLDLFAHYTRASNRFAWHNITYSNQSCLLNLAKNIESNIFIDLRKLSYFPPPKYDPAALQKFVSDHHIGYFSFGKSMLSRDYYERVRHDWKKYNKSRCFNVIFIGDEQTLNDQNSVKFVEKLVTKFSMVQVIMK
jgi:hypothetical protein|tara:strand:+ start:280 stop:693 length:414 start_codon:yes stop_codon:yes gene_type:complete